VPPPPPLLDKRTSIRSFSIPLVSSIRLFALARSLAPLSAWKHRLIPVLVGLVLLMAAALKAHQLATGLAPETARSTARWLLVGLSGAELALGLWLLSGLYPRQVRVVGLACFAAFLGVALHKTLSGHATCACLGKLPVKPLYAVVFDLAVLTALWRWLSDQALPRTVRTHPFRFTFSVVAVPFNKKATLGLGSHNPVLAVSAGEESTSSLELINFGSVPQGARKDQTIWVTNHRDTSVKIAKTMTDCACLTITMGEEVILPGRSAPLRLALDLGVEPEFVGRLGMEARGWTKEGEVAFHVHVKVHVPSGHTE